MNRISVVGCPGSGKSTLGRQLSRALDLPFVELDAIHWQPNWTPLPSDEFRTRATRVTDEERWVIDGTYWGKIGTVVWERADTVVWIDLPRWLIMWQLLRRTFLRAVGSRELWNGNRESWTGFFIWRKEESVIWWSWTSFYRNRERFLAAMNDPKFAHITFHRLRSRRAVREFLSVPSGA